MQCSESELDAASVACFGLAQVGTECGIANTSGAQGQECSICSWLHSEQTCHRQHCSCMSMCRRGGTHLAHRSAAAQPCAWKAAKGDAACCLNALAKAARLAAPPAGAWLPAMRAPRYPKRERHKREAMGLPKARTAEH